MENTVSSASSTASNNLNFNGNALTAENEQAGFNTETISRPTSFRASTKEEIAKQKQYTQGFLDALRVVQASNKFEFNGVTSPVLPQLAMAGNTPITPANASDMQTILLSVLGTPMTTASATLSTLPSPTGIPLISNNDIQMEDISMQLLASSAFPGPLTGFTKADLSPQLLSPQGMSVFPSMINNLVVTTTASTSRPDISNLTPPKIQERNSDDSDGNDSRCVSRSGASSRHDGTMSQSPESYEWMNLDNQDVKKLERKRARNRQAASKCRQKKMDRIKELEEQVNFEKQRAARLNTEMDQLQSALASFQQLARNHSNSGCPTFCRS